MNREVARKGRPTARVFLLVAALLAGLGVALGAFGAHGLRDRVDPALLNTFETAVRYQVYHALGLLAVSLLLTQPEGSRWLPAAGWLFIVGTLIFSGSLYLLVLTGARWLGVITPLGGVAFIAGWACLALTALRLRDVP